MAIRKIHHDTAAIARKYAREELGINQPKLRAPTKKETIDSAMKARLDINQIRDVVVVADKKGNEYLLNIDLDPKLSRQRNVESAMLTSFSLIPLVGAPVVAAFAIRDLVQAKRGMAKAVREGKQIDPDDQALYRMGLRHLGLAGLSTVTQGTAVALTAAKDVADVATSITAAADVATKVDQGSVLLDAAKTTKSGIVGAECTLSCQDTVNSTGHGAKEERKFRPFKAIVAGFQGIIGVHEHHHRTREDARVVVVAKKDAEGNVERSPDVAKPRRPVITGGNAPTGPPG
jgi:hypothetical protein